MSATHTSHDSCGRNSRLWPQTVIAIVVIAVVVHAMATGYEVTAAIAAAAAAGFAAVAVSRRLAH
ncbi:hypothetical protein [Nocardiopsis algeriensis]|uniref:Uncharacterized protein n=1 Tax=Nocardiopsis algeriensis TaxID=1478215 RepID=A0A841INI3_9ACTN|nr:hypothetical protein [Nocardiopsis algeriensis]MBB6120297.1 hypothetical protein [Nocardiopsis algeriensis]